jgi:hypothetical protein
VSERPVISVISITFRDPAGLGRTLASARAQEAASFEHIVVDGGGDPETRELLEADPTLRWVSEHDEGRYDAMNKGARLAHGELLWFMHGGDCFAGPGVLAAAQRSWVEEGWSWAHGRIRVVRGRATVRIDGRVPFDQRRFLLGAAVIPHQATVMTRALFEQLGGYDPTFGVAADQLLMMRAAQVEPPRVWPEVLCDFDDTGLGSTRPAGHHFRDIAHARRLLGITATGSRQLDAIVTVALGLRRRAGRVRARVRPRRGA